MGIISAPVMTLLERLNILPPYLMRVLAARYGRALGPDEIARRSGLSRSTIQRTSTRKSWAGIRIDVAIKYAKGCGFELGQNKNALRKLRLVQKNGIASLKHLKVSPNAPLFKRGANGNRLKFITKIITQ